ncbi:unnamed protein product [Cuscuta europaea]|uniref:Uncharacterized protein n=1 Tax=Cuscuta europaea TaxID=41803 RepID=A0A9P1EDM9_CUSEU|nr:unnamed protein product [Cuscuta europaea]
MIISSYKLNAKIHNVLHTSSYSSKSNSRKQGLIRKPDLAAKVVRTSNHNGKVHGSNSVRPKANTSGSALMVSDVAKVKIQEAAIQNIKDTIYSTIDVMEAMTSSISFAT